MAGTVPRGEWPRSLLSERFIGTDLTTVWRWLRTAEFEMSTALVREILTATLTVHEWLARRVEDNWGIRR